MFKFHKVIICSGLMLFVCPAWIFSQDCIRINQVGYLTGDNKIALVGAKSTHGLAGKDFSIFPADSPGKTIYTGKIGRSRGSKNTPFKGVFPCDFSSVTQPGTYRIKLTDGTLSPPFVIGATQEYKNAFSLILQFYRSQRCGNTEPLLHTPCHLNDVKAAIDASGGWHDAGDYIKFMITSGFVADELLIALDYAQQFGFYDRLPDISPRNNVPDLLEEARIGTDWILKMTSDFKRGNYYFQVGGKNDHKFWRLPQEDDSTGNVGNPRSIHKGWGGNLLGKSAAALALGARVFSATDSAYSASCLRRAEALFAEQDKFKNSRQSVPNDFYEETSWQDDMILAAAELFLATKKEPYASYAAKNLRNLTNKDISWADCGFLAYAECFRAGVQKEACRKAMRLALDTLVTLSRAEPMYLALEEYTWGSCPVFMANAQKAIMYFLLTSDPAYLPMAAAQRDYLLGRNNWGVSFVIGLGSQFPLHAHSQINSLSGQQNGGVVGGPLGRKEWLSAAEFDQKPVQAKDAYAPFQSSVVYYDDPEDYITNEVAIDYAASALFVMLYNSVEIPLRQPARLK